MRYLLDTNIVIFILKDPVGRAAVKLARMLADEVTICSVVEAELYHGAQKYEAPRKREQILTGFLAPYHSLSFDSDCVPHYASIRDHLERAGQMIGGNDLLIASIARAHRATVITHNGNEFRRVPGLVIEDWSV